jgi:stress response protein YsnF
MEILNMASTTVIGVFDAGNVRKVTNELLKSGFDEREVEVLGGDEQQLVSEIRSRGFGEEDARGYAEAVKRGKRLLAARAPEARIEQAVAIMEQYEVGGDDDGQDEEQEQGRGRQQQRTEQRETTVPVVEEELSVGKHKVARGGVRVSSHVTERPVKETVRLREEHVEAERRPADRRLSEDEAEQAFEERTIEMTETVEEVEVGKEARVVEEVALRKRAEEHEETVRDKVRRTEVEVEQIRPASSRKDR